MSNKNNQNRRILIESEYGLKFKPLINIIKDKVKFISRGKEKGIVNKESSSSIAVRDNGNINVVSGTHSQYKLNKSGKTAEAAHVSETITNKRKITADEIIINNHKLNPKLYELSDMHSVLNNDEKIVGNLNMMGTVLVKAWEPTLEKYVLIRRQVMLPVFSPTLNTPDIHPNLGVETELKDEFGDMVEIERMSNMLSDFDENARRER